MTWQPIETVPIKQRVVVFVPTHTEGNGDSDPRVLEAIAEPTGGFYDPVYSEWSGQGATHWMPLPAPPEAA